MNLIVSKSNPLAFESQSLKLKEYYTLSDSDTKTAEFTTNDKDFKYWTYSRLFTVLDREDIIGCVKLTLKNNKEKLPVEYSKLTSYNDIIFDAFTDSQGMSVAEINGLRISDNIEIEKRKTTLFMLFKALYIAVNQENIVYTYITYDPKSNGLRNLYINKLLFSDAGILVNYGTAKNWHLLRKDWVSHERTFPKHYPEMSEFLKRDFKRGPYQRGAHWDKRYPWTWYENGSRKVVGTEKIN